MRLECCYLVAHPKYMFSHDVTVQNSLLTNTIISGESSIYVLWGRPECPGNGTEIVYRGQWYKSIMVLLESRVPRLCPWKWLNENLLHTAEFPLSQIFIVTRNRPYIVCIQFSILGFIFRRPHHKMGMGRGTEGIDNTNINRLFYSVL